MDEVRVIGAKSHYQRDYATTRTFENVVAKRHKKIRKNVKWVNKTYRKGK